MKAILIDDEEAALNALEKQLSRNFKNIQILEKCTIPSNGIDAIKK